MLADWTKIAAVKAALRIPVITNGNIRGLEDCHAALRETGCDGVMSGCGVLAEPSLFVGGRLNAVPDGTNTGLPVDVADSLNETGAIPCARIEDMLEIIAANDGGKS